jgi:hypothetical protein
MGLDGYNANGFNNNASTSTVSISLTTTDVGDILVLIVSCNGSGDVSSVSDNKTGGTWVRRIHDTAHEGDNSTWWVAWTGGSGTVSITATLNQTGVGGIIAAVGISDPASTTSPWDPHAGLPANSGTTALPTPSVTASTTNANDFILAFAVAPGIGHAPTANSPFALINSINYGAIGWSWGEAYEIVSSAQSSVAFTPLTFDSASGACTLYIDAIELASTPVVTVLPLQPVLVRVPFPRSRNG